MMAPRLGPLASIFLVAFLIRAAYGAIMFAAYGDSGVMGPDSTEYVSSAHQLAEAFLNGTLTDWAWLGPRLSTMPLFTWMVTANVILFGKAATLGYVLLQSALDAGTCLIVYGLAASFDSKYARCAGLAAAFNPTQIVLSGLVFTDTPFVFFTALSLLAAARWLKTQNWALSILIGFGLGAASMCRIFSTAWLPVVLVFLPLAVLATGQRLRLRSFAQLGAAASIFVVCIAPVIVRNVQVYHAWALTPQSGPHLALWVVPLVQEAKDGMPRVRGAPEVEAQVRARFGPEAENPFEESHHYLTVARERLAQLGIAAIAKAWAFGAVINLGSPVGISIPPIAELPRTGFYDTTGGNLLEKVVNFLFLRSDNAIFGGVLLVGIAGVIVFRLIQLVGLFETVTTPAHWPTLLLLLLWCGYILAMNGPIASAKYRLPIEPALMVFTGIGLHRLFGARRYKAEAATPAAG